jgi:hypothetical protein
MGSDISVVVVGNVLMIRDTRKRGTEEGGVQLMGATFPVAPEGTTIEMFSARVPEDLHAIALSVESPDSQEGGHIDLVLIWHEEGKPKAMTDSNMSSEAVTQFNPFVRLSTDILIIDHEHRIAYCSDLTSHGPFDFGWMLKIVPMEAILGYITKRLTMDQLAEQTVFVRRPEDELRDLRRLEEEIEELKEEIEAWKRAWESTEDLRSKEVEDRINVTVELEKSKWLYNILQRLPAWLRPKMLRGYYSAMDSLFNDLEQDPRGC